MHYRTRYRVPTVPLIVFTTSVIALIAVLWVPHFADRLAEEMSMLPWLVLGAAALIILAFIGWYASSYAQVKRNMFKVRSMFSKQEVDLKKLSSAEVYGKSGSGSKRKTFNLILHLQDEAGREVWLPLNAWRDEDLLMARLLRATVDRKVRIEGDPVLVRRFSGLLDTYKSWDRQQAAA